MPVDPRAEWAQILREAWRINRDYFYAPTCTVPTGTPSGEVRAVSPSSCEPRRPQSRDPHDAERTGVGHSFLFGGDRPYESKPIPVGLLGADYDSAGGRYRFKTIYGGAFWDPSVLAPLASPGVDVKLGEFFSQSTGRRSKRKARCIVFLKAPSASGSSSSIASKSNGTDARTVVVEPIADEGGLAIAAWVEGIFGRSTNGPRGGSRTSMCPIRPKQATRTSSYFFPQADKDAIIVDERFNGGGSVADYYIDLLRKPLISHWATRHGDTIRTPSAAILGPKVMIIDETAGSGGDLLPWMFRKFGLGKLVGKRTWGGLVGILGFPVLMDGGFVTAPTSPFSPKMAGSWRMSAWHPISMSSKTRHLWPRARIAQLDRAIEVVLAELAKNPPPKAPRSSPVPRSRPFTRPTHVVCRWMPRSIRMVREAGPRPRPGNRPCRGLVCQIY